MSNEKLHLLLKTLIMCVSDDVTWGNTHKKIWVSTLTKLKFTGKYPIKPMNDEHKPGHVHDD